MKIVVNGREKNVRTKELTYEQLVRLAFENPPDSGNIVFTITFRECAGNKPEGVLIEGQSVAVRAGAVFNVAIT